MFGTIKVMRVVMDDEAGGKPDPEQVSLAIPRGSLFLLRAMGNHQKSGMNFRQQTEL